MWLCGRGSRQTGDGLSRCARRLRGVDWLRREAPSLWPCWMGPDGRDVTRGRASADEPPLATTSLGGLEPVGGIGTPSGAAVQVRHSQRIVFTAWSAIGWMSAVRRRPAASTRSRAVSRAVPWANDWGGSHQGPADPAQRSSPSCKERGWELGPVEGPVRSPPESEVMNDRCDHRRYSWRAHPPGEVAGGPLIVTFYVYACPRQCLAIMPAYISSWSTRDVDD